MELARVINSCIIIMMIIINTEFHMTCSQGISSNHGHLVGAPPIVGAPWFERCHKMRPELRSCCYDADAQAVSNS